MTSSYGAAMVNINSKSAARKRVREAQLRANEARMDRERQNVDDAASFLVELGRLAAVEDWEESRILEIQAEAERRRHEHRQIGAAAVARMQSRGETLAGIAELAGVKVSEVRAVVKATATRTGAAQDALGGSNGAPGTVGERAGLDGPGVDGTVAHALGPNGAAAHDEGVGG